MCASLAYAAPAYAAEDAAAPVVAQAEVAQANPFADVPQNSWAYDAVRQLAAAGLITGYPDNTFKGNRPMTRYEMAVLINRAVNAMQSKIAQGGNAKQADLDALKRLVDGFGPELRQVRDALAALTTRTNALTTQTNALAAAQTALKAQDDALKAQVTKDEAQLSSLANLLAQQKLGVSYWNRPGTFNQNVALSQPAGAPAPTAAGASTATFGTLGAPTGIPTGPLGRAIDFQGYRLNASGNFENRIQYAARIEGMMRWANAQQGNVATSPSFCTSTTSTLNCGVADYSGGGIGTTGASFPMRLAFDWVGYFSPGGFFAKLGRISEDEGRNADGIALGGAAANGLQVGYRDSRFYAYAFPNSQQTAASNLAIGNAASTATPAVAGSASGWTNQCPAGFPGNNPLAPAQPAGACINQGTNGIAAMAEYYFPSSRSAVGVTYDGYNGVPYTGFNPYAGLCVTAAGPGPITTAGAGATTWNTTIVQSNGYCAAGQRPLVYPAGTANAGFPVTGAYQTVQTPIKTGTAYFLQYFGPQSTPTFRFTAEYLYRFGKDPFSAANPATGVAANWQDNKAGFFELAYASKGNFNGGPLIPSPGIKNSNVVVLKYYNQGFNAVGLDNGVLGTLSYQSSQLFGYSFSGMSSAEVFLDHWFTNNFRAGITYQIFGNRNVPIPAGSPTCPGCVVSGLSARALSLDTYLTF